MGEGGRGGLEGEGHGPSHTDGVHPCPGVDPEGLFGDLQRARPSCWNGRRRVKREARDHVFRFTPRMRE